MVPKAILDRPIIELGLLNHVAYGSVKALCEYLLYEIRREVGHQFSSSEVDMLLRQNEEISYNLLMPYVEMDHKRTEIVEKINKSITALMSKAYEEKYKVKEPTLRFILQGIVPKDLPIYDNYGKTIKLGEI